MNVLIVDDFETNLKLLRAQLEAEEVTIFDACDGIEALAVLEREKIDAIVSDILMPRMDGYRLCHEVRAHPQWFGLPFVFYTATYISQSDEQLALALGADRFLRKPGSTEVIMEALREVKKSPARPSLKATSSTEELTVTKAYNERLVWKLEQKNTELLVQTTALEAAANAVVISNGEGLITWVNLAFAKLTGYTPPEILGKTLRILKSGQQEEAFYHELWETILRGQTWSREFVNRRKDGSLFHCEETITPVRGHAGAITHFIGIMNDVTERKKAEKELRLAHETLQQLLQHSPAVIYRLKLEEEKIVPIVATENVTRLLGFSVAETLSYEWWQRQLHSEDRARAEDSIAQTRMHGTSRTEYRLRHQDGSYRWVEDNRRLIRDSAGQPTDFVGVWTDISERKQAEARVATQHATTQALAESASLPEAARIILQSICQNLTWDAGELRTIDPIRKRLQCVEIWHRPSIEFQEFATKSRDLALARGEGLPGRVWETGESAWIEDIAQAEGFFRQETALRAGLHGATAFPIKLRDETIGVFAFFSAQVRAPDKESLAMFATIGSQVAQHIERQRIEAQYRQAQKMEAFGQLAGGVAHDFNNILGVILGYSSILMDEDLAAGAKAHLKEIYSASERAANLTRQLLTFSRKKEMRVQTLNLNEVIESMMKMLNRIMGEDIQRQYTCSAKVPAIEGDAGMIEQVLMNLVVNARDAMPRGGKLTVRTDSATLDTAAAEGKPGARAGEFLCLSVQDTGCGMPPEVKARIFEPFFTTKEVGKGTGLGLATVYGIVSQHQGWIEVESASGAGTTFKIFLPASAKPLSAVELKLVKGIRGGKETILLAEDDDGVRDLSRIALQRYGYRVLEARSGVEALAVWDAHGREIHLLLTDMVMPGGLTGRDLAKELLARDPKLKVIYASGYSPDLLATTQPFGTATFLQKPFHPQKLAETVRAVLDA